MELRYCEECGNPIRVEAGSVPENSDTFVCDACKQGKKGGSPPARSDANYPQASSLNFFSQQTIAIRKQSVTGDGSQRPKSSRLRIVNKGGSEVIPPTEQIQPMGPSDVAGSSMPAKSAQKLLFRCLHCRNALSIRPVAQTSKLKCPHCSNDLYVTMSGRVLKDSPSTAIRKPDGATPSSGPAGKPPSARAPVGQAAGQKPPSVRLMSENPQTKNLTAQAPASVRPGAASPTPVRGSSFRAAGPALARSPASGSVRVPASGSGKAPASGSFRTAATGHLLANPAVSGPGSAAPISPTRSVALKKPSGNAGTAQSVAGASAGAGRPAARSPSQRVAKSATATATVARPASAFEEHQASTDPDKTVFITEEGTGDLSSLAATDLFKAVTDSPTPLPSTPRAVKGKGGPLTPGINDLLDGGADFGPPRTKPAAESPRATAPAAPAPQPSLTHRVLKALFAP